MTISHDPSAPLIVVVGATGQQGGSVIKALSASDKPYRFRGITRDASKPAAQALVKQGVDMVSVSMTLENKEQASRAFEGATYAFILTNFWDHVDKKKEIDEGKMMIDAAHAAVPGIKLVVWSGLPSYTDISGGKYVHVDHFDGKAEVTKYARTLGVPFTNVPAGLYMQNYSSQPGQIVKQDDDGTYVIAGPGAPDSVVPLIDITSDYGLFVREAIESPHYGPGSEIHTCGDLISWVDMAKQLSEITGKKVKYSETSHEQYLKGPWPNETIAREIYEGYMVMSEFGYYGDVDLKASQKDLARKPRTWAEYVKDTDWSKILN